MRKRKTKDEPILSTITGEYFQPVRFHFQVLDQKGLMRSFENLRCLDHDPTQQRWVWLYDYEAKSLPFAEAYDQIPKQFHPLVLGSFFLRPNAKLLLDLRSCERAKIALPFFDKHIPRRVAKVTEAEVVNKLFSGTSNPKPTPDSLFDHQDSTFRDPVSAVQRLKDLTVNIQDPQERLRIALEEVESQSKQPLPEIERFPLHFYEEGIDSFVALLRMRQIVALEHWLGNSEYTLLDAIRSIQKLT